MLDFLRGKASERKLRLFSVACCRSVWPMLPDQRTRKAVEIAERFSDGLVSQRERAEAAERAEEKACENETDELDHPSWAAYWAAAPEAHQSAEMSSLNAAAERSDQPEVIKQTHFLRCIFGNPFRPVTVDSAWQTPAITSLAQAAYEERILPGGELDAQRLAVLADALEEAGCPEQAMLDHLRHPGPHVRGCWPVDLLLARE
jgi:hypothetical protein